MPLFLSFQVLVNTALKPWLPSVRNLLTFSSCRQEKGRPLPKFGEWDVNDPASAEGFTVIFNKARDEKKTGGKPESPAKTADPQAKPGADPGKAQPGVSWFFYYSIVFSVLFLSVHGDLHLHLRIPSFDGSELLQLCLEISWFLIFRENGFAAFKPRLQNLDELLPVL